MYIIVQDKRTFLKFFFLRFLVCSGVVLIEIGWGLVSNEINILIFVHYWYSFCKMQVGDFGLLK